MTIHYNRHKFKRNRKLLRNNSTQAEIILWNHLKNKHLHGYKFRRQYSIDQFILDFYCRELRLAIELDGPVHLDKENKAHDENRDGYIKSFGIIMLRINNAEVTENITGVINKIITAIQEINHPAR